MATATPAWGPKEKHRLLNTRLPRVDAPAKTTGTAKYTYDIKVPGMLHARFLRCPYPHARVASLDLSPALKVPGVVAAIPMAPPPGQTSLEVHFEGYPVAAVAAETIEQAEDGIKAIAIKYDVLPFVITREQALAPGAPEVIPADHLTNNTRAGNSRGPAGPPAGLAEAFARCDAIIEAEYGTAILEHACLETHGVVVDYNGGDTATVYCSTQGASSIPRDASRELSLGAANVTGIVEYMGSGFGSKGGGIGLEGQLGCRLSKEAKRPVKLMVTRKDDMTMTGNGHGGWQKFKAGATKEGKLVALDCLQQQLGGIGRGSVSAQPYIYQFELAHNVSTSVHTNMDSTRPLCAPGNPPAAFAIESVLDELAYKLNLDPIQFRKNNTNDQSFHRQLDTGAKAIGWERRLAIPGSSPGTLKRGFGCGLGNWGGGGRQGNVVTLTVTQDGEVTPACGTQDLGTGTRTYIVAIVAEELGLEMSDVHEKIGNTKLGNASSSGGSATAASVSPVVKSAAFKARLAIAAAVAPLLGAQPDDVVFADRTVSANGKSLSWKQACAALPATGISVQGDYPQGLSSNRTHGASFAEVEVDTETGHVQPIRMVHVQDCGLPLNRLAIESQINGGLIQGIGMALYEGMVHDEHNGWLVNSSFMDYKMPGCMEMPELIPIIDDGDERNAVVGMAEPPCIPPAAAIANAIHNACGVRVRDLPITPDKVLMGLMQLQKG